MANDTMIAIRLNRELADALRDHARLVGKSQSRLVRDLLAGVVMPAPKPRRAAQQEREAVRV